MMCAACKQTNIRTDSFAGVATRCVRLLVAVDTDNTIVSRRKLLVSDWLVTLVALKTFFVPFPGFVLEFLHSCKYPTLLIHRQLARTVFGLYSFM